MKRTNLLTQSSKNRIRYFDLLRTVAILFVITIHCTAAYFVDLSPESRSWLIANFFESISRWAVPIFIMISGALHLSKKRDLNSFFKKNVLKIVIILFSWNLIYGIIKLINGSSLSDFFYNFIAGHYHLWFLYMLLALYLLTPFIKKIINDPTHLKLFLLVSFIFGIALPELVDILITIPSRINIIGSSLNHALDSAGFGKIIGYSFYYVLGYYLHNKELKTKTIIKFYITGIIGLLFTFFATWFFSTAIDSPTVIFLKDLTFNDVLMSVGLFTFAKQHTSKNKISNLLIRMSKYSLGIYVMHALILENVLIYLPPMPIFLDIPIKAISCFFICLVLSFCFHKIPLLKRIV